MFHCIMMFDICLYYRIQKLEHHIMPDIGRMSMTHMEKGTVLSNSMVTQYSGEIDFQVLNFIVVQDS